MLVVTDIDKPVEFGKKVLVLHVIMDFGTNKTLNWDNGFNPCNVM